MEIKISSLGNKAEELIQQIKNAKEDTNDSREVNLKRYQDSWLYFRALAPKKGDHELLGYVEPVLREAVDNIKPSLLNVFTENEEQAVIFRPQTSKIHETIVDAINKRINDIFLRENEGKRIMGDVFTEGLITGDTFLKFYVEEFPSEKCIELEEWTPQLGIDMLLQMWPETDVSKLEIDSQIVDKVPTNMYRGKLKLRRVDLKPTVEHVAQGDLYIDDKTSVDIKDARYVGHRRVMTVGEAIDLGYPMSVLEEANTYSELDDISMSTRNLVIEKVMADRADEDSHLSVDPHERKIVIWEHYIYSSIPSKNEKTGLYQVIATDNDLLKITEVSRIPFCHGVPESIPGSFWGGSLFDRTKQLQDLLSLFQRNQLQISVNSAHTRYIAIKGKYDRQSLMNNRPGAVIEVNDLLDTIKYLPAPAVPIDFQNAIAGLTEQKNRLINTSVGSIVSGGALNNAAASTVAMTLANEELKDKVIAKSFAWTLVKPLFELMYETIRELDMDIPIEDPTGQMPAIKGSMLPPRPDFVIDVNTGNDDSIKAASLSNILSLIANTSSMPIPLIDGQKAYNIASELCKLQGIDNPDDYFIDPSKAPEPTPEQQQAAMQEQQTKAAMAQVQLDLATAQVQKEAAFVIKLEKETEELLKDGEIARQKLTEELRLKYEELALKQSQTALDYDKFAAQREAMEADIASTLAMGRNVDITVPR